MTNALSNEDLEFLDRLAAETIEPVEPPAAVRARVLDAIRGQRQLDESIPGQHESLTVRANDGQWLPAARGVKIKKLNSDATRNTVTFLVELAPNAVLPAHDHHGPEDSFVIAGSCRIGAVALNEGDFHHVDGTAHHGDVVANAEGCTLLVTVDRDDYEAA